MVNVGLVNVLLVSVCVPDRVTTVESIEKAEPLKDNPVPAVYVPAPENCANAIAVVPTVTVALFVHTHPVSAFTVPSSTKTKADGNSAAASISTARVGAPDALTV